MLTDQQVALFAEMRSDPDNPTPRLIYADWLEEHGDDARAAFIRLQCELDHDAGSPDLTELRERARTLFQKFGPTWTEFGKGVRVYNLRFGLVDDVIIDCSLLWDDEIPVLAEAPITGLRVALDDGRLVERLVELPHLPQLRRLYLRRSVLGDHGLRELLASPHFPNLEVLSLENSNLTGEGMRLLANSTHMRNLVHLDLSRNRIGAHGVAELVTNSNFPNLESLFLHDCQIGVAGAQSLVAAKNLPKLIAVRSRDPSNEEVNKFLRRHFPGHVKRPPKKRTKRNNP